MKAKDVLGKFCYEEYLDPKHKAGTSNLDYAVQELKQDMLDRLPEMERSELIGIDGTRTFIEEKAEELAIQEITEAINEYFEGSTE